MGGSIGKEWWGGVRKGGLTILMERCGEGEM
jgi:hypothetical protein